MGRKSELSLKAWFCYLDSRKCLCKSHPQGKEGNAKGIFAKIHLMEPMVSSLILPLFSPPVHPPPSFPDLRRVSVTNLGSPCNTCKPWLSAPLVSPHLHPPSHHPNTLSQRFPYDAAEKRGKGFCSILQRPKTFVFSCPSW